MAISLGGEASHADVASRVHEGHSDLRVRVFQARVATRTGADRRSAVGGGAVHGRCRAAVKLRPTFSDTLAWVRRWLWSHPYFSTSGSNPDMVEIPRDVLDRLTDTLCYAA
jgi:hypothetical protein